MLDNDSLALLLQQRKDQVKANVSPAEWQARVKLAACYRLIAHFRMTDWIYNHISVRVPGSHEHYLINPFGLLYEEISASNLVKVDVDGKLVEDVELEVNPAAFVIHGAIHAARPDLACVLHTHTRAGVGVASQSQGLLPISQHAFKVYDRIAYQSGPCRTARQRGPAARSLRARSQERQRRLQRVPAWTWFDRGDSSAFCSRHLKDGVAAGRHSSIAALRGSRCDRDPGFRALRHPGGDDERSVRGH